MLKKMMKNIMIFTLTCCSVFALVGCSCFDPEDEFPSAYNAEFEEYSMKVISIMDKIGIVDKSIFETNDNNTPTSASLLSNTYHDNSSEIWNIIEGVQDAEEKDLYYTFLDAFEQSFYIPLIVGRAISEYYGEANFYGVKVNSPWNQYVETVKQGNARVTSVYTPAGEVFEKETFIVMSIDYTSIDNYSVNFVVFNIDYTSLYYFNLDHQSNLIAYSYNSDGDEHNNFVLYSHDDFDGYEITDMIICNSVKALLMDEFTSVNKDSIRNIKNNVKHNIDETKWDWAMGYFFSGSGDGHIVDYYGYLDSENSVLASIGSDGTKTTLTIPRSVRYISSMLMVGNYSTDGASDTITLVIPETVRGIKKRDEANGEIIEASIDELVIVTHDGKTLANIVVAEESPLFMTGEGDLRDLEGNVIYHMNQPVSGGVLDGTSMYERFSSDPSRSLERDYAGKNLYVNSVHTINLEIENDNSYYELRMLTSIFPNLRTLNLSGEASDDTRIDATFATSDIEINYNITGKVNFIVDFQSVPTKHQLNILNSNIKLAYEDISNTVRASVPWSREYHELQPHDGPLERVGIESITFAQDAYADFLSQVEYQKVENGLRVKIDANQVSSVVIPETYYGLEFKEVEIWGNTSPLHVSIPSSVESLILMNVNETSNYGKSITIQYAGTYQEFENILELTQYDTIRINLICEGFSGEYTYNVSKMIINNGTTTQEFYKTVYVNEPYTRFYNIPMPNDVNMDNNRYYYTDQDGKVYEVMYENYYYIDIDMVTLKDLTLTLHQEAKTMTLIIKINNEEVHNEERPIEEIQASIFEENGERILKVYTLGGSGDPIYSYPLTQNEECNYRVIPDGNNVIVDVIIG